MRVPEPLEVAETMTVDFCVEADGFVPEALFVPCGATDVGTTAFDGADAVELPPVFEAVTVKVYEVPACRPDISTDVAVPGVLTAVTEGVEWTVNETAAPPVAGSVQLTLADVTPAVAVTPLGLAGRVYTLTVNGPTDAGGAIPFVAFTE